MVLRQNTNSNWVAEDFRFLSFQSFAKTRDGEESFPQWRRHDCRVNWVQFTDKIQNEDQTWCLRFYKYHNFQTLSELKKWEPDLISLNSKCTATFSFFSNLEPWNSNFINDIIVSRGLVQFKDQTQNEDHTWYLRFYMYHKMLSCQTCRHEKRICQLMSSWLSRGLDSLYWPDTKWGPELISQLWNFIRLVGIKKEIYIYDVSMTVTFLS